MVPSRGSLRRLRGTQARPVAESRGLVAVRRRPARRIACPALSLRELCEGGWRRSFLRLPGRIGPLRVADQFDGWLDKLASVLQTLAAWPSRPHLHASAASSAIELWQKLCEQWCCA